MPYAAGTSEPNMRFLHSADIHLDSPMRGLARFEGAPAEQLRGATRRAFERLVELAIDKEVAFVVLAGDLYDGDRDDFNTAIFLQRQLRALCDAGIPAVIALGNHDAASEITKRLRLPDRVHLLPHDHPDTVVLEDAGVALHGQSYATRAVVDDLSLGYPSPVPDLLNVGVLHTSLDGRPGHDRYAPCTLDGLVARGYAYWALGHVHRREELERDGVWAVFPGNLQGRDVGESGPKGATLVTYEDEAVTSLEHRDLAPVRWDRLALDVSGAPSPDEAIGAVVAGLEALQAATDAELHAVRVILEAGPALAQAWLREPDRYEAQLRADATGDRETLWLERVELRANAGAVDGLATDTVDAVRTTIAELRSDATGRAELSAVLAPLRARLGAELAKVIDLGEPELGDAGVDQLLDDVEALILARLGGGP